MTPLVIVDSGPLVAALLKDDRHHVWAAKTINDLPSPMFTCEAVLSEAFFLVQHDVAGGRLVREMLHRHALIVGFSLPQNIQFVLDLMEKYADIPMSLADACLVRMSEMNPRAKVLTLDSDFRIYRKRGGKLISIIFP